MDMLCIAAEAQPTGYVLVNGRTPTTTDLARLTGAPEADVQLALAELDAAGVFSRDRKGRVYNRRMVRDIKKAVQNRINGKMGGNPRLRNDYENSASVNLADKGKDKPHIPSPSAKLASKADSRELPREWAEAAVAARANEGLPDVDLAAEWAKFLDKIDGEPTEGRWLAWALKARQQRSGNGSADPGGLPEMPWLQRCRGWAKGQRWHPDWGPPPNEPGCWAPSNLVAMACQLRNGHDEP